MTTWKFCIRLGNRLASFARNSFFLQCNYCLHNLPNHSFVEHRVRGVCQLLCFTSQVISVFAVTGIVASDLAAEYSGLSVSRPVTASRYARLACTPNFGRVLIVCTMYIINATI
jgi:hypothetical protein